MIRVFADSAYWIALLNPRDQWHGAFRGLNPLRIVTTDEVLVEVLTFFSSYGQPMRRMAVDIVRRILVRPDVDVLAQTRQSFLAGLELYESRLDKQYSLIDCISMATIRQVGLHEVLTTDAHFVQEGFVLLPRK
jgi:predicted nucleic acid-binding protein